MSDKQHRSRVDVAGEAIVWDVDARQSYAGYLGLDGLLAACKPVTGEHDEVLFICVHHVSEVWMRLALHETHAAIERVAHDDLGPALKMLSRVGAIQDQLEQAWGVLTTLTPADYCRFRDKLEHASGFQSYQYRQLEFALGNKNAALIEVFRHDGALYQLMQHALAAPGLYDESLRLLARRGLSIDQHQLERDFTQPYQPHDSVRDAWLDVYRHSDAHWDLYELAEKLMDVEDRFRRWRFRHLVTVERLIGHKRGTGGSSGVGYLAKALDLRFFPELWSVRTAL